MRTRRLLRSLFLSLAAIAPAEATARAGVNWALVVGVDYGVKGQDWTNNSTDVSTALFGAKAWSPARIERVGGPADTAVNKEAIFTAMDQIAGAAQPGDSFFFYYSGHGVKVLLDPPVNSVFNKPEVAPAFDAKNEALYLTAKDATNSTFADLITDSELAAHMAGEFRAGVNKLVFLDCCYGGGFWGGNDLELVPNTTLIAAADETHLAPGESKMTPLFLADLKKNGFDPSTMSRDQIFDLYKRIDSKLAGSEVSNRKGVTVDDPTKYVDPELIVNSPAFFSNLEAVPEPGSIALLALGGGIALALRHSRIDRDRGHPPR